MNTMREQRIALESISGWRLSLTLWRSMVHPGGLFGFASPLRAAAEAALSSLALAVITAYRAIPSLLTACINMVHPGGFEPPTARFVAEYSIQLSYGCMGILLLCFWLTAMPLAMPYCLC